jgi:hypothetical protein
MEEGILSPAEKFYNNHKKNVQTYQKKHPEKCNEKSKRYMDKLRTECPERYETILEKKREYYKNVVKPRKVLHIISPAVEPIPSIESSVSTVSSFQKQLA